MKLDRKLFWDVNYNKIDWDKHYEWVIVRVFERGDVEDIRQCRRYYGNKKVKKALLKTRYLAKNRIYLASAILDEPLKKFRCYILQQSSPYLYPY